MLKIALPNKGSLSEEAVNLVREAGYNCKRYGRELMLTDADNEIEFIFLRPRDIAVYVSNGVLDMGITGRDLAVDSGADVVEQLPLGFGKSNFFYAVPEDSTLTPDDLEGARIATSYVKLVQKDLDKRGISATTVHLDGAIEISIKMGVADAIADVVQTGRTLKEAGLKVVGESVMNSEAVLIAQKNGSDIAEVSDGAKVFIERLKGIVVAREYVVIEYDIPEVRLDDACFVTPGIEAPTIAPLSKKGWYAVKAMARKKDVNEIMDVLAGLGATGIMVMNIRTCRM